MDDLTINEILEKKQTPEEATGRGVYFLIKGDEVVYVGKSETSIFSRIESHKKDKNKVFDSVYYKIIPKGNIELIETYYISKFIPKYNKTISDFDNFKQLADLSFEGIEVENKRISLNGFVVGNKLYVDVISAKKLLK